MGPRLHATFHLVGFLTTRKAKESHFSSPLSGYSLPFDTDFTLLCISRGVTDFFSPPVNTCRRKPGFPYSCQKFFSPYTSAQEQRFARFPWMSSCDALSPKLALFLKMLSAKKAISLKYARSSAWSSWELSQDDDHCLHHQGCFIIFLSSL